jgi:hypothetical protein
LYGGGYVLLELRVEEVVQPSLSLGWSTSTESTEVCSLVW